MILFSHSKKKMFELEKRDKTKKKNFCTLTTNPKTSKCAKTLTEAFSKITGLKNVRSKIRLKALFTGQFKIMDNKNPLHFKKEVSMFIL